ncbi:CAIB/BAIF family enzyme [Hyaloraphidium curvatum]|nr:CAIB/BAIF family enzyme [Hyaloraphidium curvatum]
MAASRAVSRAIPRFPAPVLLPAGLSAPAPQRCALSTASPAGRQSRAATKPRSPSAPASQPSRSLATAAGKRSHFREAPEGAPGPLEGYRVLDMTRVLAGPHCTQILGDLGAEVIKLESKMGDDTRHWAPPSAPQVLDGGSPEAVYFLCVNRNKKSVAVDFKLQEGQELIRELARESDVLVENYIPGTLSKYGLGYDDLSKINPGLIYVSLTGYGQEGPYAKRAGYDLIVEGEAGLMHITGEHDRPPVKVGVAITDLTTGLYAHGAIMAALLSRTKTGRGQWIDVNLIECQVASLANIAANYLIANKEASRWGSGHVTIVPYQALRTKDAYMIIASGNERQWHVLMERLGRPELASDPRFNTNQLRVKNRDVLIPMLEDILAQKTTDEWGEVLEGSGIPYGAVNNMERTMNHPQIKHRQLIQEVDHPRAGKIKLVGPPVHYSDSTVKIKSPPPLLGQHTREVLRDVLRYDDAKIDGFLGKKVIFEHGQQKH